MQTSRLCNELANEEPYCITLKVVWQFPQDSINWRQLDSFFILLSLEIYTKINVTYLSHSFQYGIVFVVIDIHF